jgi:hypothetical protein
MNRLRQKWGGKKVPVGEIERLSVTFSPKTVKNPQNAAPNPQNSHAPQNRGSIPPKTMAVPKMVGPFFGENGIVLGTLVCSDNDESTTYCHDPNMTVVPSGLFHNTISISPCEVFSNSYTEARQKFRQACANSSSAELYTLPVVQDEDYTIDICVLRMMMNSNKKNKNTSAAPSSHHHVIVHSSGTHGVEGYVGSAIQVALLQQSQHEFVSSSYNTTTTTTMILIHAINPYGMTHYRRVNENNVDLNRNALLVEKEWDEVLYQRDRNIAHYESFDSLFNPKNVRRPSFLYDSLWFYSHALIQIYKHGLVKLKRAMVAGQYHNPTGIFYGGSQLQPSLVLLKEFVVNTILPMIQQDNNKTTSSSKLFTWIDVHSGLGPSGEDTLLVTDTTTTTPQRLATIFPGSIIPGLDKKGDSVKGGYELTVGMLETFVLKLLSTATSNSSSIRANNDPLLFVTQEFGTIPMIQVGKALILENRAYWYYYSNKEEEDAPRRRHANKYSQSTLKPAFVVSTPTWRRKILQNGLRVIQQAIERQ